MTDDPTLFPIDADGRTPQRGDAGDTSRESHPHRSRSKARMLVFEAIEAAALRGDPASDHDLEDLTGLIHEHCSGARNGLVVDGHVSPIPDPDGKRNPLKRLIDGRRVTVSRGPWRTKLDPHGPHRPGPGRVLVWVPTLGPYGGYPLDADPEGGDDDEPSRTDRGPGIPPRMHGGILGPDPRGVTTLDRDARP